MAKSINPVDLVPWIGMGLAAVGAITTAIVKLVITTKQLEMQREHMAFVREQWGRVPQMPQVNIPPVPPFAQPVIPNVPPFTANPQA